MKSIILVAAAAIALPGVALSAKPAKEQQKQPEAFQALLRCRALTDDAQRLACFDGAAATLDEQAQRRDLVVVDRQQMRDTKRKLFGLDIPDLNPFGGGGGDEEEIKSIEGVIASAVQTGGGNWILRLEDGATWMQTDGRPIAVYPRRGHKVKISRAALGSYIMRVDGQPGVRAKRQN